MIFGKHKFKTTKEDKRGAALRFIGAFLIFALVFGTISLAVILKHNEISPRDIFSKTTTTVDQSGEQTETTTLSERKLTGSTDFLVYSTDAKETEMYFIAVIRADMDAEEFKVFPLVASGTSDGRSYAGILRSGGSKSLMAAVNKENGFNVQYYVSSTENTFPQAINYMGGLDYYIDERIEFRNNDYTLILTRGNQNIKGETLLKYFRYCNTLGVEGLKTQGKLLCAMLDNYINTENIENGAKIFQKLYTKLDSASNISYIEASSGISDLNALCASGRKKPAIVVMRDNAIAGE